MSRADRAALPPPPSMRGLLRASLADLYYNSWRFLAANVAIGVLLILLVIGAIGSGWTLVALPLLAPPMAGMMRMATRLVRDGHTDLDDFTEPIRRPLRHLVLGALQAFVLLVLVVDAYIGSAMGPGLGAFLQVSALYGIGVLWAVAAAAWALLADPARDGEAVPARIRLALTLVVAYPLRVGAALAAVGLLVVISALLIAPVLTFGLALAWMLVARIVLPAADRLEGVPPD